MWAGCREGVGRLVAYTTASPDKHRHSQHIGVGCRQIVKPSCEGHNKSGANPNMYNDVKTRARLVYSSIMQFSTEQYIHLSPVPLYRSFPLSGTSTSPLYHGFFHIAGGKYFIASICLLHLFLASIEWYTYLFTCTIRKYYYVLATNFDHYWQTARTQYPFSRLPSEPSLTQLISPGE